MNNPHASLTKYQRKVVKTLNKELGSDIPFSFEKANNNHLKVLIEGVSKPLFTSATPSDHRSDQNFISDVRSAIKQSLSEPVERKAITNNAERRRMESCKKLLDTGIKYLRSRCKSFAEEEASMMQVHGGSLDLKKERQKLCEHLLDHARKHVSPEIYITSKDLKELKKDFLRHVQFMLPNMAEYVSRMPDPDQPPPEVETPNVTLAVSCVQEELEEVEEVEAIPMDGICEEATIAMDDHREGSQPENTTVNQLAAFLALSTDTREAALLAQNNTTLGVLKEQIDVAIERNTRRQIRQVVELIKENNLPIERILEQLDKAALETAG
jgi:hypothetical protein